MTRNWRPTVTRNHQVDRFTIEKLAHDCLDVRELRRRGLLELIFPSCRSGKTWF